jgi:pSer/pThr/pTyr-binding forkhead associated (FHA) protein
MRIPLQQPQRQAAGPRLEVGGRSHALGKVPFVLGRGEHADLQLLDMRVSRRHAEVNRFGRDYRVQDLGSRNGTQVNGRKVDNERLADGDLISLGGLEIVFRLR